MSKEKVVEFMVEKCKLEYEAVFVRSWRMKARDL